MPPEEQSDDVTYNAAELDDEEEAEEPSEDPEPEEEEDEQQEPTDQDEAGQPEDEAEEAEAPQAVAAWQMEEGEDADDAQLRELLGADAYAALNRKFEKRLQAQMQVQAVASMHVTQAAAKHPELFRVYGAKIQHAIAQLPAALRQKPEAVNVAIANTLLEEAQRTGDMAGAMAKLNRMMGGEESAPAPKAKAPKEPIPAAQRPPTPRVSSTRPMARQSRLETEMASRFGIKGRALEDLMEDLE